MSSTGLGSDRSDPACRTDACRSNEFEAEWSQLDRIVPFRVASVGASAGELGRRVGSPTRGRKSLDELSPKSRADARMRAHSDSLPSRTFGGGRAERPPRRSRADDAARPVVTPGGTPGDLVPSLAPAKALRGRGHRGEIGANPATAERAAAAGVEAVPCGRPFGAEDVRRRASPSDRPGPATGGEIRGRFRELGPRADPSRRRALAARGRGRDLHGSPTDSRPRRATASGTLGPPDRDPRRESERNPRRSPACRTARHP